MGGRKITRKNGLRHAACILASAVVILAAPLSPVFAAPGDIQFERNGADEGTEGFPPAIFPHWVHRIRYRCDSCHSDLFKMERGSATVSMEIIGRGESCGQCHNGTEAFGVDFENCARCHTTPGD